MSIGYTRAEVINTEDTKTIDSNDIIDTIENNGSLVILSSGNLQVDELVNNIFTENSGSIISKNIENSVQAVFENNGIVEIAGNLRNDGIIINSGKFEIGGVLMNSNLINSGSDAVLDVDSVINFGRFSVADSACINIGSLENYGKIELTNNSG